MLLLKNTLKVVSIGILIAFLSCGDDNENVDTAGGLELLESYKINVAEPSGLAINSDGTILYTVSDNTNKIYKLSTKGIILQTFNYVGNDLEGVSTFTTNKLVIAEERNKEIVEFDMGTGVYQKHSILYENNEENSGIEGVTFDVNSNTFFILNEKNPGLLLRLRSDYSVLAEYNLTFALDYSGIFYESASNNLWIVSDQNKTINKCSLKGELIKSYPINVTKTEGVVVTATKIYVVSDSDAKLYVYTKPTE